MARAKSPNECRSRGRPPLRSDDETREIVFDAARHVFAENGYAAASTEELARRAGISTKTLYRLFPTKAALFEAMVPIGSTGSSPTSSSRASIAPT
jgi:AcrR family transcriptional regulator